MPASSGCEERVRARRFCPSVSLSVRPSSVVRRSPSSIVFVVVVREPRGPQDAFRKVAEGDKNGMKNELRKENKQALPPRRRGASRCPLGESKLG